MCHNFQLSAMKETYTSLLLEFWKLYINQFLNPHINVVMICVRYIMFLNKRSIIRLRSYSYLCSINSGICHSHLQWCEQSHAITVPRSGSGINKIYWVVRDPEGSSIKSHCYSGTFKAPGWPAAYCPTRHWWEHTWSTMPSSGLLSTTKTWTYWTEPRERLQISPLRKAQESWDCWSWRRGKILPVCTSIWREGVKKMESGCFSGVQWQDKGQWAQTEKQELLPEHMETPSTMRATEYWHRLPRKVVESPHLAICKYHLDLGLDNHL